MCLGLHPFQIQLAVEGGKIGSKELKFKIITGKTLQTRNIIAVKYIFPKKSVNAVTMNSRR